MDSLEKRAALIVEDQYLITLEIEQALRGLGYSEINAVATLKDALKAVNNKKPNIVTVDLQLIDGDAGPLVGTLEALEIPFIYLTGYDRPKNPTLTVPWLEKPIDEGEFVRAVEAATAKSEHGPMSRFSG